MQTMGPSRRSTSTQVNAKTCTTRKPKTLWVPRKKTKIHSQHNSETTTMTQPKNPGGAPVDFIALPKIEVLTFHHSKVSFPHPVPKILTHPAPRPPLRLHLPPNPPRNMAPSTTAHQPRRPPPRHAPRKA